MEGQRINGGFLDFWPIQNIVFFQNEPLLSIHYTIKSGLIFYRSVFSHFTRAKEQDQTVNSGPTHVEEIQEDRWYVREKMEDGCLKVLQVLLSLIANITPGMLL